MSYVVVTCVLVSIPGVSWLGRKIRGRGRRLVLRRRRSRRKRLCAESAEQENVVKGGIGSGTEPEYRGIDQGKFLAQRKRPSILASSTFALIAT